MRLILKALLLVSCYVLACAGCATTTDLIQLDSKDPLSSDYLNQVRRMIKSKWSYPCIHDPRSGNCEYKSVKLVIVFGILEDGTVPLVEVAEQSSYKLYDESAVNAIKLASPFPPVPPETMTAAAQGSAGIRITA